MACLEPAIATGEYSPFSFGIRRILAALRAAPGFDDVSLRLIERDDTDIDAWLTAIADDPPDVLGLSAFVWSFPFFYELVGRVREVVPGTRIAIGGPCARTVMYALPTWSDPRGWPDALVLDEGEVIAVDLFAAWRADRDGSGVGGVAINRDGAWQVSAQPALRPDLNRIPSPHCEGLLVHGRTASIETYRGCPMGCTFCQWGVLESPRRIVSAAVLRRDLEALAAADVPSAQLVDAGLNLNERAFRALAEAEADVGFFRDARLFASIYPTHLKPHHLAFLDRVKRPRLDVGVQSFANTALEAVQRPFQRDRLYRLIEQIAEVAEVELELIMGLPGDHPEQFGATVREAMDLPVTLRIFHCLALPDALLDRSGDPALVADDVTLQVIANSAWSADDIAATRTGLDRLVGRNNGERSADTWQLPHPKHRGREDMQIDAAADGSGLAKGERAVIEEALAAVHGNNVRSASWRLIAAQGAGKRLLVALGHPGGVVTVSLAPHEAERRVFLVAHGVGVSYRVTEGRAPDGRDDGVFAGLCRTLAQRLGAPRCGSSDPVQGSPT